MASHYRLSDEQERVTTEQSTSTSTQNVEQSHSEKGRRPPTFGTPRYRRPRTGGSGRWKAVCDLAWQFRSLFALTRPSGRQEWLDLGRLRRQASHLLHQGVRADDLQQAMVEAHRASARRWGRPQTFWYFCGGWLQRVVANRERRERLAVADAAHRRAVAEQTVYQDSIPSRMDEGGQLWAIGDVLYRMREGFKPP